jgi:BirA family biotin operon repressor/biotin-[acetyl-CoA-carboxylase] ligase
MPSSTPDSTFRFRGVPPEHHASLPSSNDEAFRRAAEGAPEGLVIATEHQSAGRGRMGRSWWDEAGESTLASVLLRPAIPLARYPLLGIAMACAVAEAAAALAPGARFDVKWPNDVLHDGRKLCGVLAETRVPDVAATPPLVVGFGINVNQRPEAWPDEIRAVATSLAETVGGSRLDTDAVLRETLSRYDPYVALAAAGDAVGLWERVVPWLAAPGSPVTVATATRRLRGTVDGYEPNGAVRVRDYAGEVHTLAAGEIPLEPKESVP